MMKECPGGPAVRQEHQISWYEYTMNQLLSHFREQPSVDLA